MATNPKNPLGLALAQLRQRGIKNPTAELWRALGCQVDRNRLCDLKNEIGHRKVGVPTLETQQQLNEGLATFGIQPLDWQPFADRLARMRAKTDRRRKDVRVRLRLPSIGTLRARRRAESA